MNIERAVIGSMMIDNYCIELVKTKVSQGDFHNANLAAVFRCICEMSEKGEGCDVMTVYDALQNPKFMCALSIEELLALVEETPSAANVEHYAERLRDHAKRRLVHSLASVAETAENGAQAVDEALKQLISINQEETRTQKHINDVLTEVLERTDRIFSGESDDYIKTGLADLDAVIDGFAAGGLYVLGARPSMGKTALALNFVNQAIFNNVATMFFTMEMPADEVTYRQICAAGSLNTKAQKNMQESDWPKMTAGFSKLKDKPLIIDDAAGYTVDYLKNSIRTHAAKHEKSFYAIDYLQLMQIKGSDPVRGIGEITRELKLLAMNIKRPILLLSQLNRGLEQRTDKRPLMSDLRQSGEIEQDADVIIFIYRDEVYNEDSSDKGIAELLVRKNRQGETGTVRVCSQLQYSRFVDLASGSFSQ